MAQQNFMALTSNQYLGKEINAPDFQKEGSVYVYT